VTGSSKVQVVENGKVKETVKAMELANKSDLLFIRNSITGSIECRVIRSCDWFIKGSSSRKWKS